MQSLDNIRLLTTDVQSDLPAPPAGFPYPRFIKWALIILLTLLTGLAIGWFVYLPSL